MSEPRATATLSPASWQQELAQAITDPEQLLRELRLPHTWLEAARNASRRFPLKVTRSYLQRIRPADPDDPLLRQILPLAEELHAVPGFATDPVGDRSARAATGLLHKYRGRVLLTATGACAIHCRYCFRRHFPYEENAPLGRHWPAVMQYLRAHPDVHEVILSGGDPMLLSDHRLARIYADLETLPSITTLRIHSRLPVVLPSRITPSLLALIAHARIATVYVVHVNHPRELAADDVQHALTRLAAEVRILLNQSVLLKGINDNADALVELSRRLFALGVQPYYLHLLDRVAGAAHFDLPTAQITRIQQQLLSRLPGYLVPKVVREIPGAEAKQPWPP